MSEQELTDIVQGQHVVMQQLQKSLAAERTKTAALQEGYDSLQRAYEFLSREFTAEQNRTAALEVENAKLKEAFRQLGPAAYRAALTGEVNQEAASDE